MADPDFRALPSDPVFDLYSTAIDADPFESYRRLRDEHPCYWIDDAKIWILSRYQDVSKAAIDWETFSSAAGNMVDEIPGRAGVTLGTTDPPRHDRLRALSQSAFAKKNLDHLIGPTTEAAQAALEQITANRTFDFVADFSGFITVAVLFKMLGLPARDPREIRRQVILSVSTDKALKGRNPEQLAAFKSLGTFLAEVVAERRKHPSDDLITKLAEAEVDGEHLSETEIVATTATFVMAGVESLSSFMSMLALNLHGNPQARRRLAADPAMITPAIEESLRFNTSAQRFKRVLTRDHELHGQVMKRGDKVILAYGSANRDERQFSNPDCYDIDRRPLGHLGFGAGKHFCLGTQMARLVTDVAFRCFLASVPDYELVTDALSWTPSSNFRSPVALPFRIVN